MKRVRKKASLASVIEPQLVTLTKSPANRIGFKVIRSAGEQVQRDSHLLCVELPEGVTEDVARQAAEEYGLAEQYDLLERDGRYYLCRSDADVDIPDNEYVKVSLNGGAVARVSNEAFQRSEEFLEQNAEAEPKGKSIRLTALRFDRTIFDTPVKVDQWLKENDIDYPVNGVEQLEDAFAVNRADAEGDTREVKFADGVTGTICRAEELDYPYALYGLTVEEAYGDWGWGQLDFNAMQADREYSDSAMEAIHVLSRVLENVALYSELPLDERKQLIANAVAGYAAYTIGLIDALPRSVIEQTRSDEQPNDQETVMSEQASTAEGQSVDTTVERNETEAATNETTETTTEETPQYVTRSELTDAVTAAVTAAMEAQSAGQAATEESATEEEAQRSDESEESEATGIDAKLDKIVEAMGTMGKAIETIQGEQKSLRNDFDEAEAGTVVSRSTEPEGTPEGQGEEQRSVFTGIFGRTAS